MAFSTQSRIRGWSLALSLAVVLTGVLWSLVNFTYHLGPEYYHSRRTSQIVSSTTKAPPNIATQNVRLEPLETLAELPSDDWLAYRTRPLSCLTATVEPPRSIRLIAPIALPDVTALESAIAHYQRSVSDLDSLSGGERLISTRLPIDQAKDGVKDQYKDQYKDQFKEWDSSTQSTHRPALTLGATRGNGWPSPVGLLKDLNCLLSEIENSSGDQSEQPELSSEITRWSKDVRSFLVKLSDISSLSDSRADSVLTELQRLSNWYLLDFLPRGRKSIYQSSASKIAYGLSRRVDVWKAIYRCTQLSGSHISAHKGAEIDMVALRNAVQRTQDLVNNTGDDLGWREFLVLDDLEKISEGRQYELGHASVTAQTFLNRLLSPQVTATQREFLNSKPVRELALLLQPMAASPVNYQSLLTDLEMLESNSEHRARISLVASMHSLRYAEDEAQVAVSQAIEQHYRNANIRIAISSILINRLLPKNKLAQRPVRQNILGAETRGSSDIDTSLTVRLNPDATAWNLTIGLEGEIKSATRSSKGPAIFYNASHTEIDSTRTLRISAQGLQIQSTNANVHSQDSLRGINTEYDGLPIIGDLVRYFVQREFAEQRGPAKRIMQRTIAKQTDEEFDKQLQSKISEAEQTLDQRLLGPLRNLNLNPSITDLNTTQDRLIARYRVACDDCLAASTPRPQAPSDSLVSMQMHQSAMNNAFSQLALSSREWSIAELAAHLAKQLGQETIDKTTEEMPSDVAIRFEGDRPITIEFIDGRMQLTLRIAKLSQPGRIELTDFVIRTSYIPAISGLEATLVRDGVISVDGDRLSMRERLPLRAIFAKIFAARSTIPLVSKKLIEDPRAQGLSISQVIMEGGWLALAISESQSPHVALLQSQQTTR